MGTGYNQSEIDRLLEGDNSLSFDNKESGQKNKNTVANLFLYCQTCETSTVREKESVCPYCQRLSLNKKPKSKRFFKAEELIKEVDELVKGAEKFHYEKHK